MNKLQLIAEIKRKKSFLCIGLDSDIEKIPHCLLGYANPVLEFNKRIIEATQDLCVAYKPNTAFYEQRGVVGWQTLIETMEAIPEGIFSIADAKRGDIGNTSKMYAQAFFDKDSAGMSVDAVTVAPYMGMDSVLPFLSFKDKWTILLALTSNEGSNDFQQLRTNGKDVFEEVIIKSQQWGGDNQLMYVVGATHPTYFKKIRNLAPSHFLLVPGLGVQGGNLTDICQFGLNDDCGLLVNASRSIIYASNENNFAEKARYEAEKIQLEMKSILSERLGW